jgi:hypothetical protein
MRPQVYWQLKDSSSFVQEPSGWVYSNRGLAAFVLKYRRKCVTKTSRGRCRRISQP